MMLPGEVGAEALLPLGQDLLDPTQSLNASSVCDSEWPAEMPTVLLGEVGPTGTVLLGEVGVEEPLAHGMDFHHSTDSLNSLSVVEPQWPAEQSTLLLGEVGTDEQLQLDPDFFEAGAS